jgi:hypothetical protein
MIGGNQFNNKDAKTQRKQGPVIDGGKKEAMGGERHEGKAGNREIEKSRNRGSGKGG